MYVSLYIGVYHLFSLPFPSSPFELRMLRKSPGIAPSLFLFVSIVYVIISYLASKGDFWRDNVSSPGGDLTNQKN